MKMKLPVNYDIAITHLVTRTRQTIVVAAGIMIGIGVFIFMNSLVQGFNRMSDEIVFKTTPHLRIYKEDEISQPLVKSENASSAHVLINPRIANESKKLNNPARLVSLLLNQPNVTVAMPWTTVNIFYNNGNSQLNGVGYGVNIREANAMFDIQSNMVEGNLNNLLNTPNGILIGAGIAENLNIRLNENITVISSIGTVKVMKVVGIFKSTSLFAGKSQSYMNFQTAQQLMGQGPDYVTDIYVKTDDPEKAPLYVEQLEKLTGYHVEDWKVANESFVAAGKTRSIMMRSISFAILLVAAFGIYNILNMTIMEKMNDIAILKATGFSGNHVVTIFVTEAMVVGIIGIMGGLLFATLFINLLSRVYVGGDFGYFPITLEPGVFIAGIFIGLLATFGAGYIPARKAARIDPVTIFRK